MAKSRIKGQQINILENDGNDRYYRREIREQYRNEERQQSRTYEYNYGRQDNFKYELQNKQNKL